MCDDATLPQGDRDTLEGIARDTWRFFERCVVAGADCWFSVAGGLFPERAAALTAAAMKGDHAEADHYDSAFAGLWGLFKANGSLRVMYAAANMLGLTDAQPPRPLLGADEGLRTRLASALPV